MILQPPSREAIGFVGATKFRYLGALPPDIARKRPSASIADEVRNHPA